jgi:hypothetical protein
MKSFHFYNHAISLAFLLSLSFLSALGYADKAEAFEVLTNASLKGSYAGAVTGHGGQAAGAGIGIINFHGDGTLSVTTTENLPGVVFGQRLLIPFTLDGTYDVHANGTGTASLSSVAPDGSILQVDMILAVANTRKLNNGKTLAMEVSLTLNDLGLNTGNVVTIAARRLPDQGRFDDASLAGSYTVAEIGQGGQAPSGGVAVFTFDGSGSFIASVVRNEKGAVFGERVLSENLLNGTYSVNADGTGTLSSSDGGEAIYVVTEAALVNGRKIARELFLVYNELTEKDGNLITGVGIRQ